jgi:hypothetical protein
MKDNELEIFVDELDRLLDETFRSIDSALLTDDFVIKAERSLVIPSIENEKTQPE